MSTADTPVTMLGTCICAEDVAVEILTTLAPCTKKTTITDYQKFSKIIVDSKS